MLGVGVSRGGAGFFAGGGSEVGVSGRFRFSWVLVVGVGALPQVVATAVAVGPVTETVREGPEAGVATTTREVDFWKGRVEGASTVLVTE